MKTTLLVMVASMYLVGCSGSDCTEERSGFSIRINGGMNESGECAAQVEITDGSYSEQLQCEADPDVPEDCICTGAYERAAVYEVTAILDGVAESANLKVYEQGCHVVPRSFTFF